MIGVAGSARGSEGLRCVMNRPVMAREALLIAYFFVEKSHRGRMASGALLGENRVRGRQGPGGIYSAVLANSIPRDPQDGERQGRDGNQKSPVAQRAWPLEIIEVDALREFFGCACSRQGRIVLVPQRHYGMDGAQ